MVARGICTISLLVNCGVESLQGTPFNRTQCVSCNDQKKFIKMVLEINTSSELTNISEDNLESIAKNDYNQLFREIDGSLKSLSSTRVFNKKYIFPSNVSVIQKNTIYVCVPMASLDSEEYQSIQNNLPTIILELKHMGFSNIICPMMNVNSKCFDGKVKAIRENFNNLKGVECIIVIYPRKIPSSVLVEVGYGTALSKRIVIFHKDGLTYMLDQAGQEIEHIRTKSYNSVDDIISTLSSEGMAIFKEDKGESED